MFARITTLGTIPRPIDEDLRALDALGQLTLDRQPGFCGRFVLADRPHGAVVIVTLWESEAAMRASAELAGELRTQSRIFGFTTQRVDSYEVVG